MEQKARLAPVLPYGDCLAIAQPWRLCSGRGVNPQNTSKDGVSLRGLGTVGVHEKEIQETASCMAVGQDLERSSEEGARERTMVGCLASR